MDTIKNTKLSRGFITVATGKKQYHRLASNLLKSYRFFLKDPLPFAILTDEENEYTQLFDKVILLENPQRSYMDKLFLLNHIPYDETIFVESDILVYKDLNCFFDAFATADDFSMFGKNHKTNVDLTYGMDREKGKDWGWFDPKKTGKYQDKIQWIPQFGSDIIYMRKGEICSFAFQVCQDVWKNSDKYGLKPIDDDVFALGMAVSKCKCVPTSPQYNKCVYCQMLPNGWHPEPNIHKGYCRFTRPAAKEPEESYLCHWGTRDTSRSLYKREVKILECKIEGKSVKENIIYIVYSVCIPFSNIAFEIKQKYYWLLRKIKRYIGIFLNV